jgi:hypothetical protein
MDLAMTMSPNPDDFNSLIFGSSAPDEIARRMSFHVPPGYALTKQSEIDRLWNESEALRIERDAARAEVEMARQLSVDDEMVKRAALTMHEAYQPDEGDDLDECWLDAMHAALVAALETCS